MQVRVLYLGMLRGLARREREVVQLTDGARLSDLYAELQRRMPKLQDFRNAIALSINYEYSDAATVLHDDDEVALLPPVSGGSIDEDSTGETPLPLIFGALQTYRRTDQDGGCRRRHQASRRRGRCRLRWDCSQQFARTPNPLPRLHWL